MHALSKCSQHRLIAGLSNLASILQATLLPHAPSGNEENESIPCPKDRNVSYLSPSMIFRNIENIATFVTD